MGRTAGPSGADTLRPPSSVQNSDDQSARSIGNVLNADHRGWNLRNRLAHGLLRAHDMDAVLSVWLIQTLLLLGISAAAKGDAPASGGGD
ncbi:MAG: DUF4209 domain-containing protein [Nevskiaceae bacterium]|nr:MAG: DUF4209 domain-containing protein [Nevskiaceae bacterium]TBR73002.1 MAG: DUF4209 domain-containing protein [Nevskiaceae bacterium]